MLPVTKGQRLFYAVICAAALLVAVLGLFAPEYLASIFTWMTLPPLHARFVGAVYLFGAVYMLGCLAARSQAEVRWAVQLIGIWTGMLFIISLLNMKAFDFQLLPVWIWFVSYITYPLIAIWMTLRRSGRQPVEVPPGPLLPAWAKGFLLAQGFAISGLAVLLFIVPVFMSTLWPWKVTPLLAQMYAGPLLSYGLGSLLFSRQEKLLSVRAVGPGMLAFTVATIIVSIIHFNLFSLSEPVDLIWFGAFATAGLFSAVLTVRAFQARG